MNYFHDVYKKHPHDLVDVACETDKRLQYIGRHWANSSSPLVSGVRYEAQWEPRLYRFAVPRFFCRVCHRSYASKPASMCVGVPIWTYAQTPEYAKSKTALSRDLHLKRAPDQMPIGAWPVTNGSDFCFLYDMRDAMPKRQYRKPTKTNDTGVSKESESK